MDPRRDDRWFAAVSCTLLAIPLPSQSVPWIFQWDNLPRKPSIRDAFNAGTIHHRMHSRKEAWKRWEERACACLFRAKKSLKRRGTVGSAAANPHNGRIVRNGSTNLRVIYVLITGLQRGRAPTYLFHRFQPRIMVLIMAERRTHACPSFTRGGGRVFFHEVFLFLLLPSRSLFTIEATM